MNTAEAIAQHFRFAPAMRTIRTPAAGSRDCHVFRFPNLTAFTSAELLGFQAAIEDIGGPGSFFVLEAVPEGIELRVYCHLRDPAPATI